MSLYNRMLNLVDSGLARKKVDEQGYVTFKYHNKVFYNNLWHTDEALFECRGIVFDAEGNMVQRPFLKIFNDRENGTELPEGNFWAVRKVNGFMAAASWVDDKVLVSTTGTTTSEYAQLARKYLECYSKWFQKYPTFTFVFEIVDPSDPHIVNEEPGAYLLGMRNKVTGLLVPWSDLSSMIVFDLPERSLFTDRETFRRFLKNVNHEGFVIYDERCEKMLMKVKSPYYLSKKAMMRLGKNAVDQMYDKPKSFKKRLDEEFYDVHDYLINTFSKEDYAALNEQERRIIIEGYYHGQ